MEKAKYIAIGAVSALAFMTGGYMTLPVSSASSTEYKIIQIPSPKKCQQYDDWRKCYMEEIAQLFNKQSANGWEYVNGELSRKHFILLKRD